MRHARTGLCAAVLIALLLCSCSGRFHTDAPMESFSLSHTGMSSAGSYILSAEKRSDVWQADFDLFCGSEVFSLPMTPEDAKHLSALMDTCGLWSWAGFQQTRKNIYDGEGFRLDVRFADGQTLCASGSNAFPKGYTAAERTIKAFFLQIMEKNGVNNPF